MHLQPIHRRYGYGAARLPIGAPIGRPTLASDARAASPHERSFALLPGLLCVAFALLLSAVTRLAPVTETQEMALVEPTTIEFAFGPESVPEVEVTAPLSVPFAATPSPSSAPPDETLAEGEVVPEAAPRPTPKPFDPRDLVLAPGPKTAVPSSGAPDFDWPRTPRSRPVPLATSSKGLVAISAPPQGSAASLESLANFDESSTHASAAATARPMVGSSDAPVMRTPNGTAQNERREFLARLATTPKPLADRAEMQAKRPAVATAAPSAAMAQEIRGRVAAQALLDGWDEVPLDELPDCSPPGRKDQLKKAILLATHGERTCSHSGGRYRFIETRNLNAFLMWSRTNSDVRFQDRPVRDVCDVLARALRCLQEASTEEHEAR